MKRLLILFLLLSCSISILPRISCNERSILFVLINSYDQIFVENRVITIYELKGIIKEFIDNPNNANDYSDKFEWEIPYLGKTKISKGVICVMCDRSTTYQKYIDVQNEIEKALNELRNELAIEKLNMNYKRLNKDKQKAINWAIPKNITEPTYVYSIKNN
ncbi:MAG: hypothetical protein HC831_21460 [Chloroflexia bacterium]|nr:hypothetical protein [Chloroflexia bacterium]